MAKQKQLHSLKSWPEQFEAIKKGHKTFDIRLNDRGYLVGDYLALMEFRPCRKCMGTGKVWDVGDMTDCTCPLPHGEYTGREIIVTVIYVQPGGEFGLDGRYVAMSIRLSE